MNDDNVTYLDSFGVEYIPKEIKKFTGSKIAWTNIYKIPENDFIMFGNFYIVFIDFMLKGKTLLD